MPENLLNLFKLSDGRSYTHISPAPSGYHYLDKGYDYYGLSGNCPPSPKLPTTQKCSEVVYLKSTNSGRSWSVWRTDPFQAIGMSAYAPQDIIALPNGSLIRRVNGDDLQNLRRIPHTAMLQILKPKASGVYPANWPALGAAGQVVVTDPLICKYQVSRIRRLKDGRYIALGQAWPYVGGGTSGSCAPSDKATNMLLVAASASAAERGQWKRGMPDIAPTVLLPNEWDAAQLPNGDLLALFRTQVSATDRTQIRKQAILRAKPGSSCPDQGTSGCWVMDQATLGNPGNFPHSGHPELLATREGVIIQFATTGISYTNNSGASWITFKGMTPTDYYPRSIQDANGDIYVFSHVGGDDPYGGTEAQNYSGKKPGQTAINQSITMQKFRLVCDPPC
ncbi:MAG: hypothetical protein H0T92_16875 [Pyrinomonadaceae bacterium]|nr:hypothetical protein [Pyrinomonadaceae bacterium]